MQKDKTAKATETPKLFNYSKSKRGWVVYKNGTKVKLRKYISDLAKNLSKANGMNYEVVRLSLISMYNETGLEGIRKFLTELKSLTPGETDAPGD